MKELLNAIILIMIGGAIGALVQMARQPEPPFQSITDKQQELNAMGYDIAVDGKLGPKTQLAWDNAWMELNP